MLQRQSQQNPISTDSNPPIQLRPEPAYKIIKKLGEGSNGVVFKGLDLATQENVAIKKISGILNSTNHRKALLRELKILRMINNHPNLVGLKDIFITPHTEETFTEVNLVLPYCDYDLSDILYSYRYLKNDEIQLLTYQILCGVSFLHSLHIIHRDLKPQNILVNENFDVRICDFGYSRVTDFIEELKEETFKKNFRPKEYNKEISSNNNSNTQPTSIPPPPPLLRTLSQHVCPRGYRAPEIIATNYYDSSVDMWSVGCILAELLKAQKNSGYSPREHRALFQGESCFPCSTDDPLVFQKPTDQLNVILDILGSPSSEDLNSMDNLSFRSRVASFKHREPKNLSKLFPTADPLAIDLLKKLLVFNPAKRLTAKEALSHPYLKEIAKTKAINFPLDSYLTNSHSSNLKLDMKTSIMQYYRYELELQAQVEDETETPTPIQNDPLIDNNTPMIQPELPKTAEEKAETKQVPAEFNAQLIRGLILEEINGNSITINKTIITETKIEESNNNQLTLNQTQITGKKRKEIEPANLPTKSIDSSINNSISTVKYPLTLFNSPLNKDSLDSSQKSENNSSQNLSKIPKI